RVRGRPQVHAAAGDADCRWRAAGGRDRAVADGQAAAGHQDHRGVGIGRQVEAIESDVAAIDLQRRPVANDWRSGVTDEVKREVPGRLDPRLGENGEEDVRKEDVDRATDDLVVDSGQDVL